MDTLRDKEILENLLTKKILKFLKKKLLVIGGTGFLGSHICKSCKKKLRGEKCLDSENKIYEN